MADASARYGNRSQNLSGKLIAVAAVIFAVIAVFAFVQYYQQRQQVDVTATTAGFERPDDQHLVVNVDVSRADPSKKAYCIITALNWDKDEVGRREFLIEPSEQKTERFQVTVPTRDVPVAGTVYGCSSAVPDYLGR